jgi:hypothetical protein
MIQIRSVPVLFVFDVKYILHLIIGVEYKCNALLTFCGVSKGDEPYIARAVDGAVIQAPFFAMKASLIEAVDCCFDMWQGSPAGELTHAVAYQTNPAARK